jgi:hypothetical protein
VAFVLNVLKVSEKVFVPCKIKVIHSSLAFLFLLNLFLFYHFKSHLVVVLLLSQAIDSFKRVLIGQDGVEISVSERRSWLIHHAICKPQDLRDLHPQNDQSVAKYHIPLTHTMVTRV